MLEEPVVVRRERPEHDASGFCFMNGLLRCRKYRDGHIGLMGIAGEWISYQQRPRTFLQRATASSIFDSFVSWCFCNNNIPNIS